MDGLNNFEDFISPLVEQQFPSVYRDEGPVLVLFLKAYYEYLEQTDKDLHTLRKMMERNDVDQSVDTFLEHFRSILGIESHFKSISKHFRSILK